MASDLLVEDEVEIPAYVRDLATFRRWALSDAFPETGRIDYIRGSIEVDMSPENFFFHGTPKVKIESVLLDRIEELDLGHLVSDRTRISDVGADLSAEPDIVFISFDTLDTGRARLVEAASNDPDSFVEVEGATDLVVEIVSDSSVNKDTKRLPQAYFDAGVRELWLVDARKKKLYFQIRHRGESAFVAAAASKDGFQRSDVFQCAFRLERHRHARGHWVYQLHTRPN
jgi:Uma2 family endonuclease